MEFIDLDKDSPFLDMCEAPVWIYDCTTTANIWGNRAALELFGVDATAFTLPQSTQVATWSEERQRLWAMDQEAISTEVQVGQQHKSLLVDETLAPGVLPMSDPKLQVEVLYKPIKLIEAEGSKSVVVAQVTQWYSGLQSDQKRMVEMWKSHALFQFLFDREGNLLAANNRGRKNMSEQLGSTEPQSLRTYLSIGECGDGRSNDEIYDSAMRAIFEKGDPVHRFPQLRKAKRLHGKQRWVLYEMWPLVDPISREKTVLVCEQNISQVKALEERFNEQSEKLEAQIEEALALTTTSTERHVVDMESPAEKTLKLLDQIMKGEEVSPRAAMDLHMAIMSAGDLRQPVNFIKQLMMRSETSLDSEVSQSLIQLLSVHVVQDSVALSQIEEGDELGGCDSFTEASGSVVESLREDDFAMLSLPKEISDGMLSVLSRLDEWDFDAFELSECANGRPLSMIAFALFTHFQLISGWHLDEAKLVKFLQRVEDGYPRNPYHNRIHAADVLQSMHVLMMRGGLRSAGCCDDLSMISCFLAAVIHDFEHEGVNNDFLVRTSDRLALTYNDRSPMENHHLAAFFQLLNSEEYNFMQKVSKTSCRAIRKNIIELVLATDMKQHFSIHSMFSSKMQAGVKNAGHRPSSSSYVVLDSSAGGLSSASEAPKNRTPRVSEDGVDGRKMMVLQVALKCADLGHIWCSPVVHCTWVHLLEEEFFRQGDREKQCEVAVSPLMDRDKHGITKSQVGFFDIVVLPLFQSFSQAFPEAAPMLAAAKESYQLWRDEKTQHSAIEEGARKCLRMTALAQK